MLIPIISGIGLPEGVAPRQLAQWREPRCIPSRGKNGSPWNGSGPGDRARFSVTEMDREIRLDGKAKSHERISKESGSNRPGPPHRTTCGLGGRSVGAIGG